MLKSCLWLFILFTLAALTQRKPKMGYSRFSLSFLLICALLATTASTFYIVRKAFLPQWLKCRGTIAECLMVDKNNAISDFDREMDSESKRQILEAIKYIGYDALSRNRVPCSRRGGSYHNCQPGAQANPYIRGCSKITRCRS